MEPRPVHGMRRQPGPAGPSAGASRGTADASCVRDGIEARAAPETAQ